MKHDEYFMTLALQEAEKALEIGEVPIGAVVVYNNEVIDSGYNLRETSQTTLSTRSLNVINTLNTYVLRATLDNYLYFLSLALCEMYTVLNLHSLLHLVLYSLSQYKYA